MLPKPITDLAENFIRAHDQQHVPAVEFRNIQQAVLGEEAARGFFGASSGTVVKMRDGKVAYVKQRATVILERLKETIIGTDTDWYPELSSDMTKQMADWNRPAVEAAGRALSAWCRNNKVNAMFATMDEPFQTVETQLNAEIVLFAAKHNAATTRKKQSLTPAVVYNLHGANPRVNIGSNDFSINVSNSEKIFSALRKAIEQGIEDQKLKGELLSKTSEMESELGRSGFVKNYSDFIALAANHMTVLGPFVPMLTTLLPQ
jgi:hypothetical protein